ncbi:hypothetical protein Vadar_017487 [Vaccinium darrowii]|uniref:Uncharacterized protein n=1 Tax=Vaccinium darrowii TaxID=229202 RepID=A0ACB7YNL3_9ERIC|nr:hypothetical protein Vadar_017487 [Vaccinium darrowii]
MGGGKKSPLAIQANGLVYVISSLPGTYYGERGPLFEVFNPKGVMRVSGLPCPDLLSMPTLVTKRCQHEPKDFVGGGGSLRSRQSAVPISMSMKSKRTDVGSLSPPPSSPLSSSKFDDSEVYLLYTLFDGPVRYVMYKFDTSAIGNNDDEGGNNSRRIPNCTTVFELPSDEYPRAMGSFALGSRIYLLGGEVGLHHEVDFICLPTIRLSEKVYFYDTAVSSSSSSPLSVAPPMGGGKKSPLAIQMNGLVYVISSLPNIGTFYSEEEPLFEVFNPQGGNEGEGEWSSLPRPPFYARSSNEGGGGSLRIISHAVVGQLICFFTANRRFSCEGIGAVYSFDVLSCHWEHLNNYKTGIRSPTLMGEVMQVSDSAWAGFFSSRGTIRSPISTFDLSANFGVEGRGVEGLEDCRLRMPLGAFDVSHHLLDMRNGWFCLLKIGTVNETMPPHALWVLDDMAGIRALHKVKKYISANVFRLVKRHKDKVSFCKSSHWLGRTLLPPPDVPGDVSEAVGEIQVFGAEELRSSLFTAGVESFNVYHYLVGFFAM